MNMACMAGYDADNQAPRWPAWSPWPRARKSIPRKYTHVLDGWTEPLNDFYKNRTRDDLPDGKLTDIAARTAKIGRDLVVLKGGRIEGSGPDAVDGDQRAGPLRRPAGGPAVPDANCGRESMRPVRPEIIGGPADEGFTVMVAGTLPPGLTVRFRTGVPCLTGAPTELGEYQIQVIAVSKSVAAGEHVAAVRRSDELRHDGGEGHRGRHPAHRQGRLGPRTRSATACLSNGYESFDGKNTLS